MGGEKVEWYGETYVCNKAQPRSFVLIVFFFRFVIRVFLFVLSYSFVFGRSFCPFISHLRALAFAQKKGCQCRDISSRQNKQRHVVRNLAKLRLPPHGFRGIGRGLGTHIYLHF
jgi:hypothetical protein